MAKRKRAYVDPRLKEDKVIKLLQLIESNGFSETARIETPCVILGVIKWFTRTPLDEAAQIGIWARALGVTLIDNR